MPNQTTVTLTNGVPTAPSGTVSTIDALMADGGQATLGAQADAVVAAGAAGTISAKLRAISRDIVSNIVLAGGANVIGFVNLITGQTGVAGGTGTTSASTLRTTLASDSAGIIATGTQAAPSAAYLSTIAAGDVAATASDTGNPVKVGGLANSATPTKVSAGQRVAAWFGLRGEVVAVGATRENKGKQKTSLSATTSETTIVTAAASTFLDLYGLILANTGATTTKVDIRDTTGGPIVTTIEVPTLDTRGFMVPVDSAVPQSTVNTNWTAQCAAATTAMEVTALYVKNT